MTDIDFSHESKTYKGLQINANVLKKIFEIVKPFSNANLLCNVTALIEGEETTTPLAELEENFKTFRKQPRQLKLAIREEKINDDSLRLNIIFSINGTVLIIYGSNNNTQTSELTPLIWDELLANDEEYPSFAKNIILPKLTKRILGYVLVGLSMFLFANIFFLFYTQEVGVDLKDSSLLINGNEYFNVVEEAIKSDSISKKLDVLLLKELRGFTNASEIINGTKSYITFSSFGILITLLIYLLLIQLKNRFPLVYFNLSDLQKRRHSKMVKEREVILISILVAFIINIISGIILSLN